MTRNEFHSRWTDELLGISVRTLISGEDVARGCFLRNRLEKVKELLDRIYNDLRGNDERQTREPNPASTANAVRPGTAQSPTNTGSNSSGRAPSNAANGQKAQDANRPNAPVNKPAGPNSPGNAR